MYYRLIILLAFLVSHQACIEDINDFPSVGNKEFQTDLLGYVTDNNGTPIGAAKVSIAGKEVLTDNQGIYHFASLSLNDVHNPLKIIKEGYLHSNTSVVANENIPIELKQTLLFRKLHEIPLSSNTVIEFPPVTISFDGAGLVSASDNKPYSGKIKFSASFLDGKNEAEQISALGNGVAINERSELVSLTNQAMLFLEVQSSDGRALKLKEGYRAKVKWLGQFSTLSKSTSLWNFDESLKLWKESKDASYQENIIEAHVDQLSTIGLSIANPTIKIEGMITDLSGQALNGLLLRFFFEDGTMNQKVYNASNGKFFARIPRDRKMYVSISQIQCPEVEISHIEIPALLQDKTLENIQIKIAKENILHLNFSVLDCNDKPVESGYIKLKIQDKIFVSIVKNGRAQLQYINCSNAKSFQIYLLDELSKKETLLNLSAIAPANAYTVNVCHVAQKEYMSIESKSFGLAKQEIASFDFRTSSQEKKIVASFPSAQYKIQFFYNDEVDNQVKNGEYKILEGKFFDLKNGVEYPMIGMERDIISVQNNASVGSGLSIYGKFKFYISKSGMIHEVIGYFNKTI